MTKTDIKNHQRFTNFHKERSTLRYPWSTLGIMPLFVMAATLFVIYTSFVPASAAAAAEVQGAGASTHGAAGDNDAANILPFSVSGPARFPIAAGRVLNTKDHVAVDFSGNGYRGQIATAGVYRGENGIPRDHNGSDVLVFEKAGLIVYAKPKAAIARAVKPGDVLFRGTISTSGSKGMAYAFKLGCAPAPYAVSATGSLTEELPAELKGPAPVWNKSTCDVIGFSEKIPNAKLMLGWIPGDESPED